MQVGLRDRRVDMGHARALLTLSNPRLQLKLYNMILEKGLSVRDVERLAKSWEQGGVPARSRSEKPEPSTDLDILREHLSKRFETPVDFSLDKKGRGKITFRFADDAELQRLIALFDTLQG